MSRTDALVFDCYRERLDELLDANADMGVVERTIDAYALAREEKDALWLWSRGRRDRVAGDGSAPLLVGRGASALNTAAGQPAISEGDVHD